MAKTKSKLKPKQCRLRECQEWFVPKVRSQIYHERACSLKARQARFWKETRKARKLLKAQARTEAQALAQAQVAIAVTEID